MGASPVMGVSAETGGCSGGISASKEVCFCSASRSFISVHMGFSSTTPRPCVFLPNSGGVANILPWSPSNLCWFGSTPKSKEVSPPMPSCCIASRSAAISASTSAFFCRYPSRSCSKASSICCRKGVSFFLLFPALIARASRTSAFGIPATEGYWSRKAVWKSLSVAKPLRPFMLRWKVCPDNWS